MTPVFASITVTLLAIAFAIVCALMMLVILVQKPKGGGLSGAFGGAGGSAQAAFGARTGDVLTWVTVTFFATFLLLAMGLTWTAGPNANPEAPIRTSNPPSRPPPMPAGRALANRSRRKPIRPQATAAAPPRQTAKPAASKTDRTEPSSRALIRARAGRACSAH